VDLNEDLAVSFKLLSLKFRIDFPNFQQYGGKGTF
jgi:hypothetical protein